MSDKPRYKKKRYIIPAGLLALFIGIGATGEQDKPADATTTAAIVAPKVAAPTPDAAKEAQAQASASASAAAEAERLAAEQETARAAEQAAAQAKAEAEAAAAKAAAEAKAQADAAAAKLAAEAKAQADAAAAKLAAEAKAQADAASAEARRALVAEPKKKLSSGSTYYANCSAVRAAGAAPIYAGEPGYSSKLDRDGDGVACE